MPDFKVNPDELAAGRGHHDAIAGTLGGSAGVLRAASATIADSAGHAGASAAGSDWGLAWEGMLSTSAEAVRRTGQNLAAAAHAYRETDEGQMRR
jgi:uncharacterized protein YukE